MRVDALIKRIQHLPPEQLREIEDFVRLRQEQRALARNAAAASAATFAAVWNNPDDEAYNDLSLGRLAHSGPTRQFCLRDPSR